MVTEPEPTAAAAEPIRWMALASLSSFLPEVVLPAYSYAVHGYLTADMPVILATVLPCASLAFVVSALAARRLWLKRSYQDLLIVSGLTGLGLFFAGLASLAYLSGNATCLGCDFVWFFTLILPALLLELAAGAAWLLILLGILKNRETSILGSA